MGALGAAFLHYGFDLVDEGTLLAQFARVRSGQWPYRDFHTGYGPAAFGLNAALFAVFGTRLDVVRIGLVVTHAVGLGALTALATRALGAFGALVVVALTVSFFRPIAPGAFCLWSIPYPSWYAHAVGLVAILTALTCPKHGRVALLGAGIGWGIAFCFKQNTGILGLAAALVWRAIERGDPGARERRPWIGFGIALAMTLGVLAVVRTGALGPLGSVAIAAPVLILAIRTMHARPQSAVVGDAASLATGFLVVVGPMVLASWWHVGWPALGSQLFHVASGAADVYGRPYPSLGEVSAAWARVPTGWRAMREAMDVAWFVVLPLGHLLAAIALRPGGRTAVWRLLVPAAALSYVEIYPRGDFWHLVSFAGISLTVALGVAMRGLTTLLPRRPWTGQVLLGGLLVLAAARWVPNVAVLRAMDRPPVGSPSLARARVRWDLLDAPALRAVPEVVRALEGAPEVVGFPALAAFNFLSGAPSPLRHDYFFPGVPPVPEDGAIAEQLGRARTARIVVLREPMAFFAEALVSHAGLDAAIRHDFPVVERVGPYEIRSIGP
jgi:hypothetical protein